MLIDFTNIQTTGPKAVAAGVGTVANYINQAVQKYVKPKDNSKDNTVRWAEGGCQSQRQGSLENTGMIKVLEINRLNMRHIVFYLLLTCFFGGCGTNTGKNNPDDCPSVDTVCYTDENKDSFIREMYKGVQGDLTLEEVDSILRSK